MKKEKKIYFYEKNGVKTTKVIAFGKNGRKYVGIARCNPEDAYDEKTGIEIAKWRCLEKATKDNLKDSDKKMEYLFNLSDDILKEIGKELVRNNKLLELLDVVETNFKEMNMRH